MGKVENAFKFLGQKLSTNIDELSEGMAKGVIKNMNSDKYASSFSSAYQAAAKASKSEINEEVLGALKNATDFKSVKDVIKDGNFQDDVLNQLLEGQKATRKTANMNISGKAPGSYYNFRKEQKGVDAAIGFGSEVASAYMNQEGKKGFRRTAATVGVVGGGIGLRYLSGGNMTHNNTGEKDIVGIPFV